MEFKLLYLIQNIHNDFLDKIMVFFTSLGNLGILWIILMLLLLINKKHRKCGIIMFISLIISFLIGNLFLKNIVARQRPCWIDESVKLLIKSPVDYSFPSGHTLISFASSVTIYLYNKKVGKYFILLASIIAFSRLYLFVHFPTDVLAGIILGVIVAIISEKIYEFIEKNRLKNKVIK